MEYDVIIIGGGPAGMMAAGRAGESGARVLLLEKNDRLGVKLLMTGNGRCNITNNIFGPKEMADNFGAKGKFLLSALSKFGAPEVIEFFENFGVNTKIEKKNQVFPASDRATDVLRALIKYMESGKVEVRTGAEVAEIVEKGNRIEKIILKSGEEIRADKYIIATGGKSYVATGSTGDGYRWLKKSGHKIIEPKPSLAPIVLKDKIVKELEGVSLKEVRIDLYKNDKKIASKTGEAIFTSDGMSGPVVLMLSRTIGENLPGKLILKLDFFPEMDFKEFDRQLQKIFNESGSKLLKNSLDDLLAPKLKAAILKLSAIDPEKMANSVTREERKKLIHLLKEFGLEVYGLKGFDRAMVTAGGLDLALVDPKTMRSKLIDNLYVAGEVLDLDGSTGGYNLQVSWSTGYVAGEESANGSKMISDNS